MIRKAVILLFVLIGVLQEFAIAQEPIKYAERDLLFTSQGDIMTMENIAVTTKGARLVHTDIPATALCKDIAVPLQNLSPFLALGIVAEGKNLREEGLSIRLRSMTGSGKWSEWQLLQGDDAGQESERQAYSLQILPKETKRVQILIELFVPEVSLKGMRFAFINPGESVIRAAELEHGISKVSGAPDFLSRTDWDCPEEQVSPRWMPLQTNVTHLAVHHTAMANTASDWPAVVRSIWVYHANTLGWGDIGYNWLVDPTGIIYQGRAWYGDSVADVRGGHFCGVAPDPNGINNNEQTMGVAMMGTYTTTAPPSAALNSLEQLLAWKSRERLIEPEAIAYHPPTGLTIHTIAGHREGCATECPGDSLFALLPAIRHRVDSILQQYIVTIHTRLPAGWNLISLPVGGAVSKHALFGSGSSSLYEYQCSSGYAEKETLSSGSGYWIRLTSQADIRARGEMVARDTIELACSWNLIGMISQPVAVSSLVTIPDGIRESAFFTYSTNGSYETADTLAPNRAYWVKVNATGKLVIAGEPLPLRNREIIK